MQKNILIVALLVSSIDVDAQSIPKGSNACGIRWKVPSEKTVLIQQNGQVDLQLKRALKKREKLVADLTELNKWNSTSIKSVKKEVSKDIEATLNGDFTDPTSNMYKLYGTLYGAKEYNSLIEDLKKIQGQLNVKGTYKKVIDKVSSPVHTLDSMLAALEDQIFYSVSYPELSNETDDIEIRTQNAYSSFLTDYYNLTITQSNNQPIRRQATLQKLDKLAQEGKVCADTLKLLADTILNSAPRDQYPYDDLLRLVNSAADVYERYSNPKIKEYLASNWFRQWLWKTHGDICTTPLGFTSDNFLRNGESPVTDLAAAKRLTGYIDVVSAKYIVDSNERDVLKYKREVLDYLGQTNSLFTDSSDYLKVIATNKKARTLFLDQEKILAHVTVPYAQPDIATTLYYSATETSLFLKQKTIAPIVVDDNLVLVVNNIPKNDLVSFKKVSSEPIKDVSPFMDGVNNSIGILADAISAGLSQTAFLSSFLKSVNGTKVNPNKIQVPDIAFRPNTSIVLNYMSNDVPPSAPNDQKSLDKLIKNKDEMAFDFISEMLTDSLITEYLPDSPVSPEEEIDWNTIEAHAQYAHHYVLNRNRVNSIQGVNLIKFDNLYFNEIVEKFRNSNPKNLTQEDIEDAVIMNYQRHLLRDLIAPQIIDTLRERSVQLSAMQELIAKSSVPMNKLEPTQPDATPVYRTQIFTNEMVDSATKWKYDITCIKAVSDSKKDTSKLGTISFRTGKRYPILASIGLTYTNREVTQNIVTDDNGVISVNTSREQYGVAAALHFFPFYKGVFLQDKSFFGNTKRNTLSRINIMAGLDFRKVPDNLYFGIGYDMGPGLRINAGVHLYKYRQYEVLNNQIIDEAITYKAATPFVYLGIDPVSFVNAINIFKK